MIKYDVEIDNLFELLLLLMFYNEQFQWNTKHQQHIFINKSRSGKKKSSGGSEKIYSGKLTLTEHISVLKLLLTWCACFLLLFHTDEHVGVHDNL